MLTVFLTVQISSYFLHWELDLFFNNNSKTFKDRPIVISEVVNKWYAFV